jgi:beta-galactosidase
MTSKFLTLLLIAVAVTLAIVTIAGSARRQPGVVLAVDASKPALPPQPLPFPAGGQSPDGHALSINSRYLSLDGKPWFPVMGEFHYSRYPAEDWEEEILKMKAGGIRIVSTYVFWIHHEEEEGRFDWSGQRNLRRFVEIARKHGLYFWVRVGPWAHGEARNGGLPDWILRKGPVRQNNAAYLEAVRRFYGEIGRQLKGLFWKDGGPIIGVQIENEYRARGPAEGEEHIATLRQMVRDAGLDAPFYSITGWDDAALPARGVIPVFGGYPDGFWYRPLAELPPSPHYFFTPIRAEDNVGPDLRALRPEYDARFANYPFLTAEMGGGMELAYHRRPVMTADDIAAVPIAKLGSGVALYGYYMFHGGTNPDGKKSTLQESQATGYPNDVPVKSYEFQAPLGDYGQLNPSFRDLKTVHLFLAEFGPSLAPMAPYWPDRMPAGREDRETPRLALRSDGKSGFLFLNNYQRVYPLPVRKNFQVKLTLEAGTVEVPREPVDIPEGAYTFWPVNLPLEGATLEYATAQPLTRLADPDTYVFFAWPGIAPEFAFRADDGLSVEAPLAKVTRRQGRVHVDGIEPGPGAAIRIGTREGRSAQILVLTREQARNLWKAPIGGRERLVLTAADVFFEGDGIHLSSADPALLAFGIFPEPAGKPDRFRAAGLDGIFSRYAAQAGVDPAAKAPEIRQLAQAGKAAPARMGQEVAMAPMDADFAAAARWSVRFPKGNPAGPGEAILRITYEGDVARLYAGSRLIADDFYHGRPWEIGLKRIPAADLKAGLELKILPLRRDAPIFFSAGARPSFGPGGDALELKDVRVIPDYRSIAKWQ